MTTATPTNGRRYNEALTSQYGALSQQANGTIPHPRTIGWIGTSALAMGGSNQSIFLLAALIAGQGSAAVPLLILGLLLSWAAAPGWTELILMWPNRVGGIAATCAEAFRPYSPILANLTGVCYWWGWVPTCGLTAILSATAIHEWYLPGLPVTVIASALVLLFSAVNLRGIRWATRLAIPIATASALLALLSALIPILTGHVDWQQATSFQLHTPFSGFFGGLTSAMAGLYLIGFGAPAFEAAACHVGETVDPVRNVPRAMLASGLMAAVYFIVLPVVWLGVLGSAPLKENLLRALDPTFAPLLGSMAHAAVLWFLMFNMFHGTLQPLAGASRTLMQLAEDGLLPRVLAWRSRTDAPWVATLLTASVAIAFLLTGDPTWVIAAANLAYLIGIGLPGVAVWLLRRDAPERTRPYRAPRGTIGLSLAVSVVWGLATILGFEQFGLPTVLAGLGMACSGALFYALRLWSDNRQAGRRYLLRSLHVKLTGAMLLVLTLDGGGYLLAVNTVSRKLKPDIAALEDIFVAVALLTLSVGLILPGIIAHAAGEVARAADRLATGTLADLSRAMQALQEGNLEAAQARVDLVPLAVHTKDELGAMAASFTTMQAEVAQAAAALDGARAGLRQARDDLRASNAELARWGAELERRVEERTRALQRRGEQLEEVLAAGQQLRLQQTAEDILQPVADAARAVTGAAGVAAYLRSANDPALLRRIVLSPPAAAGVGPRQLPARGAGLESAEAEGVLVIPLETDESGVAGLLRLAGLAVEPGQGERDVLAILATKAAIALDNARLLASEQGARAVAEAAVRVRDGFLTSASHDLRTPLTSIMGNADMIQMRLDGGKEIEAAWLRARMGALRSAGKRMIATVDEITDAAMLQMGHQLELKLEAAAVDEIVRAAVSIVAASAPHGAAPIEVTTREGAVVEGDRLRLERVFQNIIGNAVKYSPAGTPIDIDIGRRDQHVIVTVHDQGVGIPAAELPRIFTQFYRASTSIGITGTGIGLAGAKAIVEQHNGLIALDSAVGQGTTVTVTLPCVSPPLLLP